MTREPFERALERCTTDPQYESRLRSVYQGRHDVLDALWWAAHPLTPSPRGLSDPAAELRPLQNAVFSREKAESPIIEVADPDTGASVRMSEAEHRLQEAQRLLADGCRAVVWLRWSRWNRRRPLQQVARPPEVPESRVRPPEREARTTPAPAVLTPSSTEHNQPARDEHGTIPAPSGAAPRARKLLLAVLSGVALLAVIMFLPSVTGMNPGRVGLQPRRRPSRRRPGSGPKSSGWGPTATSQNRWPFWNVRRPTPTGLPTASRCTNQAHIDGCRIWSATCSCTWPGIARTRSAWSPFAVDGASTSNCVEEALFPDQGIWFNGDGRYSIGEDATILTESFSLLANGNLHYEATARVRQPD